ncbi:MAG: three-Cys-motif partner protein TcmP [Dehalococcoidia bacterium]|nr:three-Cys-motif partner protein TcmP [Dehalococcoidia bacterium]
MSIPSNSFFERKREWSRRKHDVLSGYLPQFTRILGQYHGRIYAVDGFAGRGYYGEDEERESGSPLLFAEIAAKLENYQLRCINVEVVRKEFENLQIATAPYLSHIDNRFGSFDRNVESILRDIGQSPTFFFLDPFGLKGLEWETMSKVGNRYKGFKTELLINFNAPKFDRDAGWLDSRYERKRDSFLRRLDKVMGPSSNWRGIFDKDSSREERYREIATPYKSGLENEFGFIASIFPIRTVEDGSLKYYLIHAARHPLGRRIIGHIFYGVHQQYLRARAILLQQGGVQLGLDGIAVPKLSIEQMEEEDLKLLVQDVLGALLERGPMHFGELQDYLADKWVGRMVEKHYRSACNQLRTRGVVSWSGTTLKEDTLLQPLPIR